MLCSLSIFLDFSHRLSRPGRRGFMCNAERRGSIDSGPELIAAEFYDWCERNGIEVVYIQSGKPHQNGFVKRFNDSFHREFLNVYLLKILS